MAWVSIKKFVQDTSGSSMVFVGFAMIAVVGFAGMAIDIGYWYSVQRQAQVVADSAAVAGGFEAMWGGDEAAIRAAAQEQAARYGFEASTVTVNRPPASGPNTGEPTAVEVFIRRPTTGLATTLLFKAEVEITGRSVAAQVAGTPACLIALKTSGQGIMVNSDSSIQANGCMVHANSHSSSGIRTNSGSSIDAEAISVVGDYKGTGYTPVPDTGVPELADPLAYLAPPANAGAPCDHNSKSIDDEDNETLSPGVYCNDLKIDESDVTFEPGVYIIRGGEFVVNSDSTISGSGVTFYFTDDAKFTLNSDSRANLSAPVTGAYPGILMFQDPNSSNTDNLFNSDSNSTFEGAVYFPKGKIMVNSGSSLGGNANFSLFVARDFEINSDSSLVLNSDYGASAVPVVPTLGARRIALFE